MLLSDGRVLHLQGINCCHTFDAADAEASRNYLQRLVENRFIFFENAGIDRYGRSTAPVSAIDAVGQKTWVQGQMLEAGMAFVYAPVGTELFLDEMLAHEHAARLAKRGLWDDAHHLDVSADAADTQIGHYAFVVGTVTKAERIKNKFYLNFGADWRDDFTATIVARDLHFFRKANIDPLAYQGKTLRVRGWVKREFGPMIIVTHPAQIDVLSADAPR